MTAGDELDQLMPAEAHLVPSRWPPDRGLVAKPLRGYSLGMNRFRAVAEVIASVAIFILALPLAILLSPFLIAGFIGFSRDLMANHQDRW